MPVVRFSGPRTKVGLGIKQINTTFSTVCQVYCCGAVVCVVGCQPKSWPGIVEPVQCCILITSRRRLVTASHSHMSRLVAVGVVRLGKSGGCSPGQLRMLGLVWATDRFQWRKRGADNPNSERAVRQCHHQVATTTLLIHPNPQPRFPVPFCNSLGLPRMSVPNPTNPPAGGTAPRPPRPYLPVTQCPKF
jgi:hypothetical protein